MGGTRDGVIANSSQRYGVTWEDATTPVKRTFQESNQGVAEVIVIYCF